MDNSRRKLRNTERACKPCRDLKVRCLPGAERGDVCQKCQRSGACCIYEEPKQRKKRKATEDRITVEILEAKVSELAKQIETSNSQRQVELNSGTHDFLSLYGPPSEHLSNAATPFASGPAGGTQPADSGSFNQDEHIMEHLFRSGILSTSTADLYLLKYRQMCTYSPFVIIPEGATVTSLRQDQPFLLHALLAVTSRDNQPLQVMLERSLRKRLLETVMIEGEKSIELLQTFLVYLAWEHFFYVPKKRHFDQMLQVAISMCVDMGLDHGPSKASARKIGFKLDHHYSAGGARDDLFFSKPARRAYIGCYYLSATSAWVWRKPTNIHCTDYMMECAQSLSKDPEYETDALILPLLQIHRLGDGFHDKFLSSNLDYSGLSSSDRVQTHLITFQTKMNDVLSNGLLDCLPISLAAHSATSYAHEMDHLTPCLSNNDRPNDPKDCASTSSSQLDVLMVCLNSARTFVESFLSAPLAEYPKLSASQWWDLICNIIVLYTLSIGIPQLPHWNVSVARDKVTLEIYLDLLCYHMQSITGSTANGRDLFSLMGQIFTNVKNTYKRLKKLPQTSSSIDKEPVHATTLFEEQAKVPLNKPLKIIYQNRCPAFPFRSSTQNFANPLVEAHSDVHTPFEFTSTNTLSDMDSFQDESSWLGDIPDLNLGSNLSSWNFDMA